MIRKIGNSPQLGNYVVLEDTYGNRYTYAELGKIVRDHRTVVMPTGKEKRVPVESQNIRPAPLRAAGPRGRERRGRQATAVDDADGDRAPTEPSRSGRR